MAAGRLLLSHRRHESGIGLQFAVDLQRGGDFPCQARGLHHLIHHFVIGRAFRRETQHRHVGFFKSCHRASRSRRADGDLRQLIRVGHRRYGHIAHHENAILAILLLLGDKQHRTAHAGDSGRTFDDLQRGAQRLGSRRESTRNLAVGTARLDDHTAQIERIFHQFARLLDGHSLRFAQFAQQLGILLALRVVERVDDGRLVDVRQSPFLGIAVDFVGVSDEDDVGHFVGQNAVGSTQCALLVGLREHDALLVSLRPCHDLM